MAHLGFQFDGDKAVIDKHTIGTIADTLLALINKELSERLEKLHTEMDERMREEVAIEKRMGEKKAENAKKEVARKILDHITEIARDKGIKLPIEMLDAFNV